MPKYGLYNMYIISDNFIILEFAASLDNFHLITMIHPKGFP